MLDINEIAKKMTREEFMNCIDEDGCLWLCDNGKSITIACPNKIGLKEEFRLEDGECKTPTTNCKKCWYDAIKDIKFKNDDICPYCQGKGRTISHYEDKDTEGDGISLCNFCNGTGKISERSRLMKKAIRETKEPRLYYGDEILAMIRKSEIKEGQEFYLYHHCVRQCYIKNGKDIKAIYKKDNLEGKLTVDDECMPLEKLMQLQFKLIEPKCFTLEAAIRIAKIGSRKIKHKDWDNFIPKRDLTANIVFLIKDNKLDVADLNRKIWEVK